MSISVNKNILNKYQKYKYVGFQTMYYIVRDFYLKCYLNAGINQNKAINLHL